MSAWLEDQFGLRLSDIFSDCGSVIQKRGTEYWMLPERYLETFQNLPSKSIGMRIAMQSSGGLIPDNDWISRFSVRISGNRLVVENDDMSGWLHGSDIRTETTGMPKGTIVIIEDQNGIFLGCGRVSGDRIRNFNK